MTTRRDVWLEAGVVWAAAEGALADSSHQILTQRAVAMAAKDGNWRLMFDYRRATLTHDVLALSRHAELLSRLALPESARTAMLCRQRSTNFIFWERVLRARARGLGVHGRRGGLELAPSARERRGRAIRHDGRGAGCAHRC